MLAEALWLDGEWRKQEADPQGYVSPRSPKHVYPGKVMPRHLHVLADALAAREARVAALEQREKLIEQFCEAHLPFASEKSEVVARRVLWTIRGSNDDPPHPDRAVLSARPTEETQGKCSARRVHPLSSDYYIECRLPAGHAGQHFCDVAWSDDSKYAIEAARPTEETAG